MSRHFSPAYFDVLHNNVLLTFGNTAYLKKLNPKNVNPKKCHVLKLDGYLVVIQIPQILFYEADILTTVVVAKGLKCLYN
jgi:hypothetical protein